jgi:YidC/Oxa1 family membrane protein insertase
MPIGYLWQTLLETPLINFMVVLARTSYGSYGLAILLFTVITRLVTFPLTLRTLHATKKLQDIGPELQEIQKRYSDPKRRSEETMKLYKENGVNPLGCLGPTVIQMPIFIALYATIRITLGNTPENMLVLSSRLYDIPFIRHAVPLSTDFFGMDLAENGTAPLGILVFVAMWLQQRISSGRTASTAGANAQQAQMNQMMQWFFPIFFGYFFVVTLPAALGIYWGASTAIGVILQWVFVGPGDFKWSSLIPSVFPWQPAGAGAAGRPANRAPRAASGGATESGDNDAHASGGSEREDGRGGSRPGTGAAGPQSRTGRRRRNPRR